MVLADKVVVEVQGELMHLAILITVMEGMVVSEEPLGVDQVEAMLVVMEVMVVVENKNAVVFYVVEIKMVLWEVVEELAAVAVVVMVALVGLEDTELMVLVGQTLLVVVMEMEEMQATYMELLQEVILIGDQVVVEQEVAGVDILMVQMADKVELVAELLV
jgi:hypothetical protein